MVEEKFGLDWRARARVDERKPIMNRAQREGKKLCESLGGWDSFFCEAV